MNDADLLDFLAISGIEEPYLGQALQYFRRQAGSGSFYAGEKRSSREEHISYETLLKYLKMAADDHSAAEILAVWRSHRRIPEKIRGDFHVHSDFSDGIDGTASLIREAACLGYRWLAFCDHAPNKDQTYTLTVDKFFRRVEASMQAENASGLRVYQGIEADILEDGSLNIPAEIRGAVDFALASFHYRYGLSEARLAGIIESAFADQKVAGFAHPFFILKPGQDDRLLRLILDLAERYRVAIEINLAPYFLTANLHLLQELKHRSLKVMFSTDAHCRGALALMRFSGYFLDGLPASCVLNFDSEPPLSR